MGIEIKRAKQKRNDLRDKGKRMQTKDKISKYLNKSSSDLHSNNLHSNEQQTLWEILPKVQLEWMSEASKTRRNGRRWHCLWSLHAFVHACGFVKCGAALAPKENGLIGVDGVVFNQKRILRLSAGLFDFYQFLFFFDQRAEWIVLCNWSPWWNSGKQVKISILLLFNDGK